MREQVKETIKKLVIAAVAVAVVSSILSAVVKTVRDHEKGEDTVVVPTKTIEQVVDWFFVQIAQLTLLTKCVKIYADKEAFMALSKGKKILIGIVAAVVAVGSAFGIAYAAGAFNNTNLNLTPGGPSVGPGTSNPGTTIVTPTDPGTEITDPGTEITDPGTEITDPGTEITDPGTETPSTPEVTITEAEYKAMFLEELPTAIENYYNSNVSINPIMDISQITIKGINFDSGDIYLSAVGANNREKFFIANFDGLNNLNSYEGAYSLIDDANFTFSKAYSVQDASLANEIAEFALQQGAVVNFLSQNGISANSNYIVLNATEFNSKDGIRTSNVVLKINNKILKFDIGGATGACSSQQEYVNKIKNGYLDKLENFEINDYSELSSASASETYTFTSSYGNVKGTMVFNNGIGSMQFEEQSM